MSTSATHLKSKGVSLTFTPTEAVLSSSEDEDEDDEPGSAAASGDHVQAGNSGAAAAAADNGGGGGDDEEEEDDEEDEAEGSERDDDGDDGEEAAEAEEGQVEDKKAAAAGSKAQVLLPGAAALLSSVHRNNLSFRKKKQGTSGFTVQTMSLDPHAGRRKRKEANASGGDFFRKRVTHEDTPNLGQMLQSTYETYAEQEDRRRQRENELGITEKKWKNADWNWAPTGRALPDNKRDHK